MSVRWNGIPTCGPLAWTKARHSQAELSRAVAEGVLFNIAQYVETIERQSGITAEEIVLSGNGFREPLLAPLLATLLGRELIHPDSAGLGSLRGAAIYAWRGLGHDASPALEKLLAGAERVNPLAERVRRRSICSDSRSCGGSRGEIQGPVLGR